MVPTLRGGDLLLVTPWAPRRLRRDDLVVALDPRDRRRETVKRVVAVAGEVADLPGGPAAVPAGHVALAGDAPAASTDSRHFGPVPVELVVGRVWARVRPRPALLRGGSTAPETRTLLRATRQRRAR